MSIRRGDVVIVADPSGEFTGKPRPAVVIQADAFGERTTVTICPVTSVETDASLFRVALEPSERLALARRSWAAVDLVTTVRRSRLGAEPIGRPSNEELALLTASLAVYLGIG